MYFLIIFSFSFSPILYANNNCEDMTVEEEIQCQKDLLRIDVEKLIEKLKYDGPVAETIPTPLPEESSTNED